MVWLLGRANSKINSLIFAVNHSLTSEKKKDLLEQKHLFF